ncbi:MAG TPA: VOC family protein [Spirochaetota bacterium]|nr:VOC family protein [Spirochaetota bacterium]HQE59388.1 VOC family protein [Spirochaetota bacterium]
MFNKLAHICLNVSNLDSSLAFYKSLSFKVNFVFTRNGKIFGAYLEISPGSFIELFENPEQTKKENCGLAHFCLEADDIDVVITKLTELKIPHTEKKLGCDGTYQIWLKDPDGYPFEVHQYTKDSSQFTMNNVEADW